MKNFPWSHGSPCCRYLGSMWVKKDAYTNLLKKIKTCRGCQPRLCTI